MPIKTSSAKAKARALQQKVRDSLLAALVRHERQLGLLEDVYGRGN